MLALFCAMYLVFAISASQVVSILCPCPCHINRLFAVFCLLLLPYIWFCCHCTVLLNNVKYCSRACLISIDNFCIQLQFFASYMELLSNSG